MIVEVLEQILVLPKALLEPGSLNRRQEVNPADSCLASLRLAHATKNTSEIQRLIIARAMSGIHIH
jgi:hypothetical protein